MGVHLRLNVAIAAGSVLVLALGAPAQAVTRDVSMDNNAFTPQTVSIARGDTVRWTNNDSVNHNSVGNAGLNLWHSGTRAPGGVPFSRVFAAAGSYGYRCTFHGGMTGTVQVPITLSRSGNTITVRVASANAASGFQHNIWRRVGSGAWSFWASTTAQTRTLTGTAGTTYSFKSRLMRISNSTTSAFSAVRSLTL